MKDHSSTKAADYEQSTRQPRDLIPTGRNWSQNLETIEKYGW
jgi:hypothetical protein